MAVEKWEELWMLDGHRLKKAGLDVRDRRCVNDLDSASAEV